jgi:hypothetical protein
VEGESLILSVEEFRQLAKMRGMNLSATDLERIYQHSAGWVTGAILMLEFTRGARNLDRPQMQGSGAVLYDYVAQEVFSGFDEVSRTFLLKVCWPRRLSLAMAEALGEEPRARQLLTNLSRNNYFVTERFEDQECEYILHPLLREFLQAQAARTLSEPAVAVLQQRTATLLAGEGQVEEAVELLAECMDWHSLEELVARHAGLLVEQGRTELLTRWLEELPPDRLDGNAWLLYWQGMARLRHSAREARRSFESAFRRFSDMAGMEEGSLLACRGIIEAILLEMDDFSLLDPWIAALQKLLAGRRSPGEKELIAEVILLAALAIRDPGHPDLAAKLGACEQNLRREAGGSVPVNVLLWIVQSWLLCGELARAGELLAGLKVAAEAGKDDQVPLRLLLLTGLQALLCGDGPGARDAAEKCQAASGRSAGRIAPLIAACGTAAAITLGVMQERTAAVSNIAGNRLSRFFGHYLQSWQALIEGDVIAAHHEQRLAQSCATELGVPFLEVLSGAAYAQLLFRCDDTRTGTAQLRRVHSIARDLRNPLLEFMTLLIYGEVALGKGRISSGTNALRYALGLGRQHGYYCVPWWHGAQLADLMARALEHRIETDYVRDFIRRRNLQPTRPPVDLPDWPWPLRIATLGGLSIRDAENHEIGVDRIRGRPLEVLKVLLALGGRDVPAEQVAGTLWPHVDSDYSSKSLTINLHRLRRLLGYDDAILLRDGRLTINPALVWVDLFAVEAMLARIAAGSRPPGSGSPDGDATADAERLAALCRGPFLPGDGDYECFAARRQQCKAALAKASGDARSEEARRLYEEMAAVATGT